jgi:hypothetical protein
MGDALPAVIVPSGEKAGRKAAMLASSESALIPSSSDTVTSPRREAIVTGVISPAKNSLDFAARW